MVKKWTSYAFDQLGLFLLHKKKSRKSQFKPYEQCVSINTADWDLIYPAPEIPNITFEQINQHNNYQIGKYFFDSPLKSDYHLNDIASGLYHLNTKGHPVHVVLVHGWRMDSLNKINNLFLKPFQQAGFHMYHVTLPFHFERSCDALYSGEYMISADLDRSVLAVRQAVTEIRALIRWIKQNHGGKIVLIGVSLGGFISNLTAVVEDQIDLLISIMYANTLSFAVWNTPIGKYIKQDMIQNGITYPILKRHWEILEPSRKEPKVNKNNILLIAGLYDQYVLFEDSVKLWEAWNHPHLLTYPCGHSGIVLHRKKISNDVMSFITSKI
jgi:predicted alpha/beta-fold hydrolase